MKRRKPIYKLVKTREATMEDVNGAAYRAVDYLIGQGVLKENSIECDDLFVKLCETLEKYYNYPDYGNYN